MSEGGNSVDGRLATIQGGIEVLKTLIESSGRINDERHARVTNDVDDIRTRVHRHANEITAMQGQVSSLSDLPPRVDVLEDAHKMREGERKGIGTTLKIAWMVGGGGATALLLSVASKAGLL